MNAELLLQAFQSRAARVAITASASRGRGNAGVVAAARAFMRDLDLARFGVSTRAFEAELDLATDELVRALPRTARRWGIARKLLNIFLRDSLYTSHLCNAYRLDRAEKCFEIPLDSVTALCLKRAVGRGRLPPWPGVRGVSPGLSQVFQVAAQSEAERAGVARVHLDAVWWSQSRD